MLTAQEQHAVRRYNEDALRGLTYGSVWADWFSQSVFDCLPPDHTVVDVGCGYGRIVPILEDLGIQKYIGIDPAEEQLNFARRLHPPSPLRTFEVGTIYDLGTKYTERFDGFLLMAVLMHIPAARLDEALSSLRRALKIPGTGMFAVPVGGKDEEARVVEIEPGFFVTVHNEKAIEESFRRSGFSIKETFRAEDMLLGSVRTR
ncbi:MAG: class I SAM-dependent methyltransferase [Parcubacteria group bacterium]|nr:class I SAM-dependent methyltransferase [Parcubacteria group bacterium]